MPNFQPLQIPLKNGHGNLPEAVTPQQPYDIFSLFFDDEILTTLADHTHEYAELHQP